MKKILFLINVFFIIFAFESHIRINALNDNDIQVNNITIADKLTMFGGLQNDRWFVFQPTLDDAEDDY